MELVLLPLSNRSTMDGRGEDESYDLIGASLASSSGLVNLCTSEISHRKSFSESENICHVDISRRRPAFRPI